MDLSLIFAAFGKALGQTGDRRFRRVLFLGIGLTLALLVLAFALLLGLVEWATGETTELPLVGPVTWVGDFLRLGSLLLMIVLSMVLMVPVASAITSMFLDEVAQAVEDRHYPGLQAARRSGFWNALRDTVNFLGVLIAANVLAIFLYIMLPFAALFIFWGLNGLLLGREYFQLVALRRLDPAEARALRKRNRMTVWAAGTLMAMPLSIPLVNLLIPILGAATFTHLFHGLATRAAARRG
jgi:CysZ protein